MNNPLIFNGIINKTFDLKKDLKKFQHNKKQINQNEPLNILFMRQIGIFKKRKMLINH